MNLSSLSNTERNLKYNYQSLSSGKRINSAKDDASGLAIAEKLKRQVTTSNVRVQNAKDEQGQINIKDGIASGVTDNLHRMYELSLKASNGLYSDDERNAIQSEISQIKDEIGSETLQELGLEDYDVSSGNFDISQLKDALGTQMSVRSNLGAQSNGLDYMMANLSSTAYNLTASQSRIEDLDVAKGVSDLKKNQTLQTYAIMMHKRQMENEHGRKLQLFARM